jgi:hypothetical protein
MAAPPVVSLWLPALVSPAAITLSTAAVSRVALGVVGFVAQPAGFPSGSWGKIAVVIQCQQFTQPARWCVPYLDAGFRQTLCGPSSHITGDENLGPRSLHPMSGRAGAGMRLAGQGIGLKLKLIGSGVPKGEERSLAVGDVKTGLLAGSISARN